MRVFILLMLVTTLASCGGSKKSTTYSGGSVTRLASGPISRACLASERKASSPRLCGCIQTVANRTLDGGDQRLAAKFFGDPHHAQEIRQSDRSSHEVFWKKYKSFASSAERSCRGY
ncbi:hypothetical protein [Primorskyibacter sedentarius]|uniref:Arginine transporter n=1 Tax=Primorskyibacter sedentarius TaxID=745311 RepID=A0A4R3JQ02_9RHOB|nr:hypothetical protein [Primorskyibacter sedentarius]TCS67475.1 hypothetical protein EDD52_101576 [Primorskyibacter sedentarius]